MKVQIKILKILLTAFICLVMNVVHAQDIGGAHFPLLNSTHTYTVTMDGPTNNTTWALYPDGTNLNNVETSTPVMGPFSGTKSVGIASVSLTFSGLTVGDTYIIVFRELNQSSAEQCDNYRFYSVKIQDPLDIDLADAPASDCPEEPVSYRRNPNSTGILSYTGNYTVSFIQPSDYNYNWKFAFEIKTQATSGTAASIHSINITGDGGFTTQNITLASGPHDYNQLIENIPKGTTAIQFSVNFTFAANSGPKLTFSIENMSGAFLEIDVDGNNQTGVEQAFYQLPFPSAITAVD